MPKITPFLWFDTQAEEAAQFSVSLFPHSKITSVTRYPEGGPAPAGSALTVSFVLDGAKFTALHFAHRALDFLAGFFRILATATLLAR